MRKLTYDAVVADIGETHMRFAVANVERVSIDDYAQIGNDVFPSVAEALAAYLRSIPHPPRALCIAITNTNDAEFGRNLVGSDIEDVVLSCRVCVIDALDALSLALPDLAVRDLSQLSGGSVDPCAPKVVLSVGDALGVAAVSEINRVCTTFPASAGSISFAPEAQKEPDIVERIRCTSDYVSVEKILSAPGLTHIYELLLATSGQTVCSRPAADIIEGALKENDAMAAKAVDDFATTLARFAGGIGLVCEARGSVYLWGSMLRRMERKLRGNFFRAACEAKSRNSSWLAQTPVFLIRSEGAILRGAAVALSRQVH